MSENINQNLLNVKVNQLCSINLDNKKKWDLNKFRKNKTIINFNKQSSKNNFKNQCINKVLNPWPNLKKCNQQAKK